MSRCSHGVELPPICFPRVSGDEPERRDSMVKQVTFSPRERG